MSTYDENYIRSWAEQFEEPEKRADELEKLPEYEREQTARLRGVLDDIMRLSRGW